MYARKSKTGQTIVWKPDDDDLAQQAVEESGGLPENARVPDDAPIDVDDRVARDIRDRYAELHVEKYGSDSPYYEPDEDELEDGGE